jgi:hypothetical protein
MRLNKAELAGKLRVSQRSLTTWQKEGLPVLEHGRRGQHNVYDLAAVVAWIKKTGRGLDLRMNAKPIDIPGLERELGLNQPPQLAPAPPEFPCARTIQAIEEAMGVSLVKACAITVKLLGLAPGTALKAWEVAAGELAGAFDDAHGFDSGPNRVRGDTRELNETGGRQRITKRIEQLAAHLDQDAVDLYDFYDDD